MTEKEEHKCAHTKYCTKYFSIIRIVQTVLNWEMEIGAAIFNKFSTVKVLN